MKRRDFLAATAVGPGALLVRAGDQAHAPGEQRTPAAARMTVGCQRSPTDARMLEYFKRHGVDHICGYPPAENRRSAWSVESLSRLRDLCDSHGVRLEMVQVPFLSSAAIDRAPRKAIMLGRDPDRQQEMDEACEIVRHCARVEVPAIKYNLNLLGVLRTEPTPGRGGSVYSTWRLSGVEHEPPLTAAGVVPADVLWERITWFLERIVPVADEHRVRLACHPHDPGVPPRGFRGIPRVLGTVEGLKRFVDIQPSPYHGLNFCVGTVAEMLHDPGAEILEVIRHFGTKGKIFNIHFRNIRGRRDDFSEVYPDEGDLDMLRVMMVLKEVGYGHMVMPDHMPRHGDDPDQLQAFAFGYGYIKAMIQAAHAGGRAAHALASRGDVG
jgi:mannonate dehydratase